MDFCETKKDEKKSPIEDKLIELKYSTKKHSILIN